MVRGAAAAVLQYKRGRNIVNTTYQTEADNIFGIMTMAALNPDMLTREGGRGHRLHRRPGFAVASDEGPPRLKRCINTTPQYPREGDLQARGTGFQNAFEEILTRVCRTHARRKPKARLVRLLALMFPHDMTCLMDAARVWGVHRLGGASHLIGDFVAQHAALHQRIREAVGEAPDLAFEVDQSIFTWFLWKTLVDFRHILPKSSTQLSVPIR